MGRRTQEMLQILYVNHAPLAVSVVDANHNFIGHCVKTAVVALVLWFNRCVTRTLPPFFVMVCYAAWHFPPGEQRYIVRKCNHEQGTFVQKYDSDTTVREINEAVDATIHSTQFTAEGRWVVEVELHDKNGRKIGGTLELMDTSFETLDAARNAGEAQAKAVVQR